MPRRPQVRRRRRHPFQQSSSSAFIAHPSARSLTCRTCGRLASRVHRSAPRPWTSPDVPFRRLGSAAESGCQPVSLQPSGLRSSTLFSRLPRYYGHADFAPAVDRPDLPGKVHGLSGRASRATQCAFRRRSDFVFPSTAHRSHLRPRCPFRVRQVVPSIHPSSSTAVARPSLGLHYGCRRSLRRLLSALPVHAPCSGTLGAGLSPPVFEQRTASAQNGAGRDKPVPYGSSV